MLTRSPAFRLRPDAARSCTSQSTTLSECQDYLRRSRCPAVVAGDDDLDVCKRLDGFGRRCQRHLFAGDAEATGRVHGDKLGRLELLALYSDLANVFVAGFIGSPEINLLELAASGNHGVTESGDIIPLPTSFAKKTKIVYGIRPQHIRLSDTGMDGVVSLVEPTGENQELVVRLGSHDLNVVVQGGLLVKAGAAVKLDVDAEKVLLFDVATGERLR